MGNKRTPLMPNGCSRQSLIRSLKPNSFADYKGSVEGSLVSTEWVMARCPDLLLCHNCCSLESCFSHWEEIYCKTQKSVLVRFFFFCTLFFCTLYLLIFSHHLSSVCSLVSSFSDVLNPLISHLGVFYEKNVFLHSHTASPLVLHLQNLPPISSCWGPWNVEGIHTILLQWSTYNENEKFIVKMTISNVALRQTGDDNFWAGKQTSHSTEQWDDKTIQTWQSVALAMWHCRKE